MTTLTLAKLAQIEAAAALATAGPWKAGPYLVHSRAHPSDFYIAKVPDDMDRNYLALCDPATVAALCQIVKAAAAYVDEQDDDLNQYMTLKQLLRDAGLIEP